MNGPIRVVALLAMGLVLAAAVACSADDQPSSSEATLSVDTAAGGDGATLGVAPEIDDARPDEASEAPAAPGPGSANTAFDRKVIQDASMLLKVQDVQQAFDSAGRIAGAAGGAVYESAFFTEKDYRVGTLTVRVPADRYQGVLSQLRALGLEVVKESSATSDVTQEYTDLESRLRNLEATEAQYLLLMNDAETVDEILLVQDRLTAVRGEIEVTKGRLLQLENLTALATIRMELRPEAAFAAPPAAVGNPLTQALRDGWEQSLDVLGALTAGVLTAVAFSWWLVPLGLVVVFVVRRVLRNRPQPGVAVVDTTSGQP